jgi:CRISPR/Cas system CSM-associated protein Csm3 (group 7 of RAMP superfamily)
MNRLKVEMTFSLDSPYHVSADRVSFGIDKAIYIDPRNDKTKTHTIPATTLKGVLRHHIEAVLRAKNVYVCEAPRPDRMCRPGPGKKNCVVCEVFGSPRIKSRLSFHDIVLNSDSGTRMGVGIERRRKTAREDHLFSFEVGYAKQFSTKIKGVFPSSDDAKKASALLFAGAKAGFALGGAKSRGLGWITLQEFKTTIDDAEIPMHDIEAKLREVLS